MKKRPEGTYHNKAHVISLSTPTPAFCAVCRRRAGACGHGTLRVAELWSCRWDECGAGIFRIREMSTADFDELEQEALVEAGKAGFAYLKSLPDTEALRAEFVKLDTDQALEFLERIVDGFGAHLKFRLVADNRPRGEPWLK